MILCTACNAQEPQNGISSGENRGAYYTFKAYNCDHPTPLINLAILDHCIKNTNNILSDLNVQNANFLQKVEYFEYKGY